jgi:hypothetical protein
LIVAAIASTVLAIAALALEGPAPAAKPQRAATPVTGLSILGAARLSASQMQRWYVATGHTPRLANGMTVLGLASLYLQEGHVEHVRGDVAFAQAILETGYFSFPSSGQARPADNNFAGLGACDACTTAARFPTAEAGVRAQIQLLRTYADTSVDAANLADTQLPPALVPRPVSAPAAVDRLPDHPGRSWETMGNGRWASAAAYGTTILAIYRAMRSFAATDKSGA